MAEVIALSDAAYRRVNSAVKKVEAWSPKPQKQPKRRPVGPDYRFFMVKGEGPAAESDFTDERYYVQLVEITNSDDDPTSKLTFAAIPDTDDRYLYASATNLAEWVGETHNLTEGAIVPVFTAFARASIEVARRFFNFPA